MDFEDFISLRSAEELREIVRYQHLLIRLAFREGVEEAKAYNLRIAKSPDN